MDHFSCARFAKYDNRLSIKGIAGRRAHLVSNAGGSRAASILQFVTLHEGACLLSQPDDAR
jgi:hypothetical protein